MPGVVAFSVAAFVGRFPHAMLGLAVILPISKLTGSYSTAGAVAACALLGIAIGGPLVGRFVDRHGQRRILVYFTVLHWLGLSALIGAIYLGAPLWVLCIASVVSGASRVPAGTMARTRWAHVVRKLDSAVSSATLRTAYAFESVVDEVIFISAPIVVTVLSTAVHPLAGLVCCLLMSTLGSLALAAQRDTEPPVRLAPDSRESALAFRGLWVIAATTVFLGASAGAVGVAVVASADSFGTPLLAGPLLATLAFSSMLSGLWYGARKWKLSPAVLWVRGLTLLVVGLVPLAFARTPSVLAAAMFAGGVAIAPTSIAVLVLTERLLPPRLLNEGMNVEATAMALGVAGGGWLSGALVDSLGPSRAVPLPALCTLVALLVALPCSRWLDLPEEGLSLQRCENHVGR